MSLGDVCAQEDDAANKMEEDERDYVLLDPCVNLLEGSVFVRTSTSWDDLKVRTGDTVRIHNVNYVVETPRDGKIVTISHPWKQRPAAELVEKEKNEKNNKSANRNINNVTNCTASAYRMRRGLDHVTFQKMSCCMSTRKGSDRMLITGKLREEVHEGQVLKSRGRTFRVFDKATLNDDHKGVEEEEEEEEEEGALSMQMSSVSTQSTCQGMTPRLVEDCTRIPGRTVLTFNSTNVVTTEDTSMKLEFGDHVSFDVDVNHEHQRSTLSPQNISAPLQFTVSSTVTKRGYDISEPWRRPNTGHLVAYRCSAASPGSREPGQRCDFISERCRNVVMDVGSKEISTTGECDVTESVEIGDVLRLCGEMYMVMRTSPSGLWLDHAWRGRLVDLASNTQECQMCRTPRTESREILEEYSEKYGRCDSVLCMARLEAEERRLGRALSREEIETRVATENEESREKMEEIDEKLAAAAAAAGTTSSPSLSSGRTSLSKSERSKSTSNVDGAGGGEGSSGVNSSSSSSKLQPSPLNLGGITLDESISKAKGSKPPPPPPSSLSPFGDPTLLVPGVRLDSDGNVVGGVGSFDEKDIDATLLNSIKAPLENVLKQLGDKNPSGGSLPDAPASTAAAAAAAAKPTTPKIPKIPEEDDEEDDEGYDEEDDTLDEDGTPADSKEGNPKPKPKGGGGDVPKDGKLPKHETDPAFDKMKPSKVPPGSSKTFKRFMNCGKAIIYLFPLSSSFKFIVSFQNDT